MVKIITVMTQLCCVIKHCNFIVLSTHNAGKENWQMCLFSLWMAFKMSFKALTILDIVLLLLFEQQLVCFCLGFFFFYNFLQKRYLIYFQIRQKTSQSVTFTRLNLANFIYFSGNWNNCSSRKLFWYPNFCFFLFFPPVV